MRDQSAIPFVKTSQRSTKQATQMAMCTQVQSMKKMNAKISIQDGNQSLINRDYVGAKVLMGATREHMMSKYHFIISDVPLHKEEIIQSECDDWDLEAQPCGPDWSYERWVLWLKFFE